ncbi:MAG: DEAD/DEAH box helicase family protein, partial [Hyphomicrobiaceae bacterium]|nr:DEAD/DEAH box helicase family protein [Hyphomicrobiaceae bacterium]
PNPVQLVAEPIAADYIVLTQRPTYQSEAAWKSEAERPEFIDKNKLRFLRPYQLRAVHALQRAVKDGKDRFLFEMATGTGKTLTAASIIKLFIRTGNARRVLFLVDRLELEDQAQKAFIALLKPDVKSVIYKETRDEWRHAEVVVTTVQSLLFNNKYQRLFSPTDFDLVISDEAHRSIGGNARAVFDYFVGYKLGLTATPRDYLKKYDTDNATTRDPREAERRILLDTYRTFGCEDSQPTFRYSLLDGVKDGFLINPTVIDARTEVTTKLLSDAGYVVPMTDDSGEEGEVALKQRDFEKRFFSDPTNKLFCKTFLENGLRDPISGEFGKSIVFAVSQPHATKLTQILNEMADQIYPGKYQSDFAVQVTSQITDAQQFTINFTNNNLMGSANIIPAYRTSKARVCVTVGMMTTGYDCPDLLNLGLFRPVFSPTDFIQIKGRGTRKHSFFEQLFDDAIKTGVKAPYKTSYKLFDFFATCEFFEEKFNYDEVLKLPKPRGPISEPRDDDEATGGGFRDPGTPFIYDGADLIATMKVQTVGADGMKIDRMFFEKFEDLVKEDPVIAKAIEAGQWDHVIDHVNREVFAKPDAVYSLDRLRKASGVDRRIGLREILEKIFNLIPRFKSKDELLEEEFAKFVADSTPDDPEAIPAIKTYFKAYVTDPNIRIMIDDRSKRGRLHTSQSFNMHDFMAVPEPFRTRVPDYIKDYVSLNQFMT